MKCAIFSVNTAVSTSVLLIQCWLHEICDVCSNVILHVFKAGYTGICSCIAYLWIYVFMCFSSCKGPIRGYCACPEQPWPWSQKLSRIVVHEPSSSLSFTPFCLSFLLLIVIMAPIVPPRLHLGNDKPCGDHDNGDYHAKVPIRGCFGLNLRPLWGALA